MIDFGSLFRSDRPFHGVKGLLFFDDDNILVYERDGNTSHYPYYLDLPGGGAEPGETPFETFNRELDEEFAITIKPEDVTYARLYPAQKDPSQVAWFLAARTGPGQKEQIKFGDEGTRYMIMPVREFMRSKYMPTLEQRVRDYLDWALHKTSQTGVRL